MSEITEQNEREIKNEFDSVTLDPEKIFLEEDDGFYRFTSETQLESRKIGYEVGKSVLKQRLGERYKDVAADSLLRKLKKIEGVIDDYRLDGNQLSFGEEYDPEGRTWETSIFFRYSSPEDLVKLKNAVKELGLIHESNE